MKTKPRDIKYCGVDESKIKNYERLNLNPDRVKLFHEYILERYKIHLRKDVYKYDEPYTENPVLLNFKFTNIRREHDRTTKWLINNISTNENISYIDKIYKTLIFRIYNRIETVELIQLESEEFFVPEIYNSHTMNWLAKCQEKFKDINPNYRLFTNAYKTGGTSSGLKSQFPRDSKAMRPLVLVDKLIHENFAESLTNCSSQDEVFNMLKSVKGIGLFLAYQLFVDLTYIEEFPFSENEFVVVGPGCKYGIELLLEDRGIKDLEILSLEEILFWIKDNIDAIFEMYKLEWNPKELFSDLPEYDRYINIMSLENIFCEFQKYVRASTDCMPNPKNRYKPFKYEDPFNKKG